MWVYGCGCIGTGGCEGLLVMKMVYETGTLFTLFVIPKISYVAQHYL